MQVEGMFDNIAPKYDFLNHLLSLNIDKLWRKKLVKQLGAEKPMVILDVATGTADLAIAALKCYPKQVYGIDISEGMLEVGRKKIEALNLSPLITLAKGDAEQIPFADNTFDAVMVAFGVRNFENLEKGLAEMHRVTRPGGSVFILEFTMPRRFPVKQFYGLYFKFVLPLLGRIVSKDNAAYEYLPDSVAAFPQYHHFLTILSKAGFKNSDFKPLSLGIACLYRAKKAN